MLGVDADDAHNALALDDLALLTYFLDRCSDFHGRIPSLKPPRRHKKTGSGGNTFSSASQAAPLSAASHPWARCRSGSGFVAVADAAALQVVGRQLHQDPIPRQDTDIVLAHLAGYVSQDLLLLVAYRNLHAEHGIGQRLDHDAFDLNAGFLGGLFRLYLAWRRTAGRTRPACRASAPSAASRPTAPRWSSGSSRWWHSFSVR